MSTDNDRAIEAMTDEEIEQHKCEILEQFGPNVLDLFRRAKQAKGGLNQRGKFSSMHEIGHVFVVRLLLRPTVFHHGAAIWLHKLVMSG